MPELVCLLMSICQYDAISDLYISRQRMLVAWKVDQNG
jgi:hypothetical protein